MNTLIKSLFTLALIMSVSTVIARDTPEMLPIQNALDSPAAKEKLDPSIKFYFGEQAHPTVLKKIGNWRAGRHTNKIGKTDTQACNGVFITVLHGLQQKARQYGANAIIEIKSNVNKVERSSESAYMCMMGAVVVKVALKAQLVKLTPEDPK